MAPRTHLYASLVTASTVNQELHAALKSCGFTIIIIPRKSNSCKFAILGGHTQCNGKISCDLSHAHCNTLHKYARIRCMHEIYGMTEISLYWI